MANYFINILFISGASYGKSFSTTPTVNYGKWMCDKVIHLKFEFLYKSFFFCTLFMSVWDTHLPGLGQHDYLIYQCRLYYPLLWNACTCTWYCTRSFDNPNLFLMISAVSERSSLNSKMRTTCNISFAHKFHINDVSTELN